MVSPRIISFSLYGSLPLYTVGAIRNAELVHRVYPGWIARFYVDDTVPPDIVAALANRQAQIVKVDVPSRGPCYGRYWRLWIAGEPGIERFIVRDADSRLNSREMVAVEDWIKSGRSFHLMRDAAGHRKQMLTGMWGAIGGALPNIRELVEAWGRYSAPGESDQFMSTIVFPRIGSDYLCHDSFCHFDDATAFPPHAPVREARFVGDVVLADIESTSACKWSKGGMGQMISMFRRYITHRLSPQQLSESQIHALVTYNDNLALSGASGSLIRETVRKARNSLASVGLQFPSSDEFISFVVFVCGIRSQMIAAGLLNDAAHLSVHLDYLAKRNLNNHSDALTNGAASIDEQVLIDAILNIVAELMARQGGYSDLFTVRDV